MSLALVAAIANHVWLGASPLVPGYAWSAPDARDRAVEATLALIPPAASVAATSAVYPHLATRAQAYWFPSVQSAEYVAVDVASNDQPLGPRELKLRVDDLLARRSYGVADASPGFLLLGRGSSDDKIPAKFYDFARAGEPELAGATSLSGLTFGEGLRLTGYRLEPISTTTVFGPSAILTTYWQVDRSISNRLGFKFYLTREPDGAIVGELDDPAPEAIWYPPSKWQPGEVVALRLRFERVHAFQAIGVAVIDSASGRRLAIRSTQSEGLWENETIARITTLSTLRYTWPGMGWSAPAERPTDR